MDKPNFALLLAKGKKPDDSVPTDHAGDLGMGKDVAEESAVKDLLAAVKSGDAQSFGSALKDFLEICYPQLADESNEPDEGSPTEEASDKSEPY